MAVHTVGPGKDYATLAAWAAAELPSGTGDATAECYAGADLGGCSISSAIGPPPNTTITIIAAVGNRHNGTDAGHSGVAYTTGSIEFATTSSAVVQFMRLENAVIVDGITDTTTYTVADNLCVWSGAGSSAGIQLTPDASDGFDRTVDLVVVNNIIYFKIASGSQYGIALNEFTDGGSGVIRSDVKVVNNTVIRSAGSMVYGIHMNVDIHAFVVNHWINNIVLSNGTCYAIDGDLSGLTTTDSGFNLSTDATGDDFGVLGGNLINQTASAVVTNTSTNATLKTTSPAKDAGTAATSGFGSPDAIGVTRPQGSAWDMGALELVAAVFGGGGGGGFWPTWWY